MKKFLYGVLLFIVFAGIWNDLSSGSLPSVQKSSSGAVKASPTPPSSASLSYQELAVSGGDTVISIVEELHPPGFSLDIEQTVTDFQQLNDGISPEQIRIGSTYKFPFYD